MIYRLIGTLQLSTELPNQFERSTTAEYFIAPDDQCAANYGAQWVQEQEERFSNDPRFACKVKVERVKIEPIAEIYTALVTTSEKTGGK